MKKIFLILLLVISLSLVGCDKEKDNDVKRYEVVVVEKHGASEYIVKTNNYKVIQIWFMEANDYEYELKDILYVAVVDEHIVVPYVEYIDMTIDGYKYIKGKGWVRQFKK